MHTNMNFPAPLSAMGFVAAFGGLVLGLVVVLIAALIRKMKFAMRLLRLAGMGAAAYMLLLFGFSLASHQVVLAQGQEKYFCEIDCHLAYSVEKTESVSDGDATRVSITVKTRFDPKTISASRPKDASLAPSPRTFYLVDADNHVYRGTGISGTPFTTALRPGDAYETVLSFVVPKDHKGLRLLLITSPDWQDHFLIGEENSWLHHKTYFAV